MAVPSDSNLRNRLISKQLDVGKRKNDATSESANDPGEAVESTINAFAQSPSSADRLRGHQGPIDDLIGGAPSGQDIVTGSSADSQSQLSRFAVSAPAAVTANDLVTIEDIQAELLDAGYSPGSIDGSFGPKTLEALNLFQQDQVDALKIQSNNMPLSQARTTLEATLQRFSKQPGDAGSPAIEALSVLDNAQAKTVAKADNNAISGLGIPPNTLNDNNN